MKDKNKKLQEELESIGMINNVDKLNIEDGIRGSAQMALSTALKDSQRHRRAAKEMNDKQEAEARKVLSREISNKEHPEPLDYLKPNSQIELKESLFESIEDAEDKVFQVTYKHSPEIFSSVMVKASNEDEAREKLSAKKPGKVIVGVKIMSDDAVKDMKSRGMSLMEDANSSEDESADTHKKAEETPTSQQNGIQNMLQFLIKDEWDAIEGYNNTIQTLKLENAEDDILGVLQEISNEELVHVGQLQKLLELVNPITSKIKEGEAEATEQISDDPVQQDVATESEDNSDIHTESLIERELSTKENSISKIFIDNKDKINATTTKQSLVDIIKDLLKDLSPSRTDRIFRILDSKKDYFSALQYIYDFILKGDDFGVIK